MRVSLFHSSHKYETLLKGGGVRTVSSLLAFQHKLKTFLFVKLLGDVCFACAGVYLLCLCMILAAVQPFHFYTEPSSAFFTNCFSIVVFIVSIRNNNFFLLKKNRPP